MTPSYVENQQNSLIYIKYMTLSYINNKYDSFTREKERA